MKRFIILIIFLGSSLLIADEPQTKKNYYRQYLEHPTYENFKQAIEYYSSEIEKDTTNQSSRIMLSYLHLNEINKQIDELENEIETLSNGEKFQFANLLLSLGEFDKSIKIYESLNEQLPNWSCPWRHKGEAYLKIGKLAEAEFALLKAIETRVEHYDAYVMLAEVQYNMNKKEEALKTLETGLSYKGKDIEDPEKEVSDLDVQFFYMKLLEENNRIENYNNLKKKLQKSAPDAEHWKEF
jgi:tetratricopeptide (TPR) repeat protein